MKDRLLTPEEAAAILSVSPKSIRAWLRSRKLKGVKAGRLWRVREDELAEFLKEPHRPERGLKASDVRGLLARSSRTVDDFLREKHEQTAEEERRWEERIRE